MAQRAQRLYTSKALGEFLHESFGDRWGTKKTRPADRFLRAVNVLTTKVLHVLCHLMLTILSTAIAEEHRDAKVDTRVAQTCVRLFGSSPFFVNEVSRRMIQEGIRMVLRSEDQRHQHNLHHIDRSLLTKFVDRALAAGGMPMHLSKPGALYWCGAIEYLVAEVLSSGGKTGAEVEWPPLSSKFLRDTIVGDPELRFILVTRWAILKDVPTETVIFLGSEPKSPSVGRPVTRATTPKARTPDRKKHSKTRKTPQSTKRGKPSPSSKSSKSRSAKAKNRSRSRSKSRSSKSKSRSRSRSRTKTKTKTRKTPKRRSLKRKTLTARRRH
jgi:hypothetical protein